MTTTRSRHVALALALLAIIGGWVALIFASSELWAQAEMFPNVVPIVNWFSLAGIIALMGLAVQWGKVQERGQRQDTAIASVREELDEAKEKFVTHSVIVGIKEDIVSRIERVERDVHDIREMLDLERRTHRRRGTDA